MTTTRTQFTCHDCHDTFTFDREPNYTGGTGYAVLNDEAFSTAPDADVHKVCYECSRKRDLADAAETGKLFAYVVSHYGYTIGRGPDNYTRRETVTAVQTWPGLQLNVGPINTHNTWRSNFGDTRTAFSCQIATGKDGTLEKWHGLTYGDNGTYCRLRRAKVQS